MIHLKIASNHHTPIILHMESISKNTVYKKLFILCHEKPQILQNHLISEKIQFLQFIRNHIYSKHIYEGI